MLVRPSLRAERVAYNFCAMFTLDVNGPGFQLGKHVVPTTYISKAPWPKPCFKLWESESQLCQYPRLSTWVGDLLIHWQHRACLLFLHKLVWTKFKMFAWMGALNSVDKVVFLPDDCPFSEYTVILVDKHTLHLTTQLLQEKPLLSH